MEDEIKQETPGEEEKAAETQETVEAEVTADAEKTTEAEETKETRKHEAKPAAAADAEKQAVKLRIKKLKARRQEAIESGEADKLKEVRRQMKKLKRKLKKTS